MTIRPPRDPGRYTLLAPALKKGRTPGLRIRHIKLRSCVHVIPHPGDPATGRAAKDYHILLDGEGDCIVSPVVWSRIQQTAAANDYLIVNEVWNPPDQGIGWGLPKSHPITRDWEERRNAATRQVGAALQDMTPTGVRPSVTVHQVPSTNGK